MVERINSADALALRIALASASDEILIDRHEVAAYLNTTPSAVTTAVFEGRLPKPLRIGGGVRGILRWRLGDLRAVTRPRDAA